MQTRASPIPPDLNGVTVYGQWVFSKQTNAAAWCRNGLRVNGLRVQCEAGATRSCSVRKYCVANATVHFFRVLNFCADLLSTNAVDKYVKSL
jgi:hypothetical protein